MHRTLNVPENIDEIDIEVAYQFIKHLENNRMFHEELKACERHKWANCLIMLPYSKRSPECGKKILADLNALLKKPLLEILEI